MRYKRGGVNVGRADRIEKTKHLLLKVLEGRSVESSLLVILER